MGQSVHATGFRLGTLKNWESKSCFPEKERYMNDLRKEWLIRRYLINYFDYVLPRLVKSRKKKGLKERKREYQIQNYVRKEAHKRLYKKWKEGNIGQFEKKRTEKESKIGRFFFKPEFTDHWSSKCKYKEPRFLYSHSWIWSFGKEREVNIVLYSRLREPSLEEKIKWQKIVSKLPTSFNRGTVERYVENYERMMRSRQFPDWTIKEEKKATYFYSLGGLKEREWYNFFIERQWKRLLESKIEARIVGLFFSSKDKVKVKIHLIKRTWITSSLCARYFLWRLRERRCNFSRLIRNFLAYTNFYGGEKHNLYGIFISGAGRFTKKQRASYIKVQRGRVPFSTPTAPMDYCDVSIPLKYGACSIRVWVCHLRRK